MISLAYLVDMEDSKGEQKWLNDLKIYPAIKKCYVGKPLIHRMAFGVIVSEELAVIIKLRHPVEFQQLYK